MPSSSINGTSSCIPTSPSLLLAFAVGRTGSVGGSVDGLTVDDVFEDVELFTGVSGVATSSVLSDSWTVDNGVVSEIETIEVDSSDTVTEVPVTRVGLTALLEVIITIAVVVAGVFRNDVLN